MQKIPPRETEIETAIQRGVRVLVVDDCIEDLDAVGGMLETAGYRVEPAATAGEALWKLASFSPDVVLTDVGMPGLSGLDLIRILREREYSGGVIVMSGNETLDDAKTAMARGALGYLGKPISFNTLQDCMQRAADSVRCRANERRHLVELEEMRTFFLSSVAHELRTPVNIMLTYLDLLKAGIGDPVTANSVVGDLFCVARRLKYLVNNTVVIAGLHDLLETPVTCLIDPRTVIEREIANLKSEIDEKDLTVIRNLAHKDLSAPLNEKLLSCVVGGIVNNAVKFSPAGSAIRVSLDAVPGRDSEALVLEVHDHGCGIPKQVQDSLTEPFVHEGNPMTRGHGGTGIGLYLVKRIVEELGGFLVIESRTAASDGTLVQVTLPRERLQRYEPAPVGRCDPAGHPVPSEPGIG